jgi:hypothetical protein
MIVEKRSSGSLRVVGGIAAVLAGVVGSQMFLRPMLLERRVEKELMSVPAFQQIARWEPVTYKKMKDAAVASTRRGESPAQVQGAVRGVLAGVLKQYIPVASDEALIEYMRVMIDEIEQMTAKDPEVSYAMLFNNRVNVDVTKYIDETLQKRDMSALSEIIRTGVRKDAGYQNDQNAERVFVQVMEQFIADFGPDGRLPFTMGRREAPPGTDMVEAMAIATAPVDKKKTCEMTVAFYRRILELRSDRAAQVLRMMLSKA